MSEYNDSEALELFARSLLATENYKSALDYCKIAVTCPKNTSSDKDRLDILQAEIESIIRASPRLTDSAADMRWIANEHQMASEGNCTQRKTKRSKRHKRPKAKTPSTEHPYTDQQTNLHNLQTHQGHNDHDSSSSDVPTESEYLSSDSSDENPVFSVVKPQTMEKSSKNPQTKNYQLSRDDSLKADLKDETFYQKSEKYYADSNSELNEITELETLLKNGLTVKDSNTDEENKSGLDNETLTERLQQNPHKYIRCIIQIIGPHESVCTPVKNNIKSQITISGRSKAGQAFMEDEVVVEVYDNAKMHGKVIGILERKRHKGIKHPVFLCTSDEFDARFARPICNTVPKIKLLHPLYRQENFIYVYKYDDELIQDNKFHINEIKTCIITVALLKWSQTHQYPLGVVIKILPQNEDLDSSLRLVSLKYRLPYLYHEDTVKQVSEMMHIDEPDLIYLKNRTNLTSLNVFTIDPTFSTDLDDAISIEQTGEHYLVGVHIADVASFIQKGSECDIEALYRATTFYSGIAEAATRHMFPEPLSTNVLSLKPGKVRLTLSVFFTMNIDGCVTSYNIQKTYIQSKRQLSYIEAQQMILSKTDTNKLTKDIQLLHTIAKALRWQRLGNAMHALNFQFGEQGEESIEKTFEARYLIEEFMILSNKTIADVLCQKYPGYIPLRCHPEPSKEHLNLLFKKYDCYIDTVVKMQNKTIPGQKKPSFRNVEEGAAKVFVSDQIWEEIKMTPERASDLLRKDQLFPFQFLVWQDWLAIQEHASYVTGKENAIHYDLGTQRYVHCTSPIRRYNDLIIQRILHACLDKREKCPYEKGELAEMYKNINSRMKTSLDYRKSCQTLKLAAELETDPQMMLCFISDISDKGIELSFPQMAFVSKHDRQINFNTLQVDHKPVLDITRNTTLPKAEASWTKRIYDYNEQIGSTNKYSTETRLNPHQGVVAIPISNWASLLDSAFKKTNQDIRKEIKKTKAVYLSRGAGTADIKTSFVKQCDVQPYVKFTMSYTHGQTVKVLMSTTKHKGTIVPKPVLYHMTDSINMCLMHIEDPVMHLAEYANQPTCVEYKNTQEYVDRWMPLILMEAATCSIRNEESICISHVPITVTGRSSGQFSLSVHFCETRRLNLNELEEDEDQNIHKGSNDSHWLCLKFILPQAQVGDYRYICPSERVLVAHAHVVKVTRTNRKDEELQVSFELHRLSSFPKEITEEGHANIEIIEKSEEDRRTMHYIHQLLSMNSRKQKLPEQIALQKKIPPLDTMRVRQANINLELPGNAGARQLPRNNDRQQSAIDAALKNRLTLIQGPPGTGKTNSAIKLIYLFDKINQQVSDESKTPKKKVLFCGPSNKSVDLVARLMLERLGTYCPNIVRVYGQTIEEKVFPVPGHLPRKGQTADDQLKSVSLHLLIRKDDRRYAKEIQIYDKKFKEYRASSQANIDITKGYKKLIRKASVDEIKQHDVILCTTSVACSIKVTRGADIQQVIIDEAAMCQEPQCLGPIIANKVEQVVLIGDHKQLKPIIMCKRAANLGLDMSLFERYASRFENNFPPPQNFHQSVLTWKGVKFIRLTDQYRMDPYICEFPSERFYAGSLTTLFLPNVLWAKSPLAIDTLGINYPHVLIDVKGEQKIQNVSDEDGNDRSRCNDAEVKQVVTVYKYLIERGVPPDWIRILSQYNAQCSEIRKALDVRYHQSVSTVVTSQGGEWDYVIFSTVCSLPPYMIETRPSPGWCKQNLGFITDKNQINVALTRARKGLFIIGNKDLLSCDSVWNDLIRDYEAKASVLLPDEFPPSHQHGRTRRTKGRRRCTNGINRSNIPGLQERNFERK
ncbi:helicase with zinc finger domain 2-like isoform X2 [Mercenaria mercenaria]|nr:helicase with zinc finger domain 2-like isoform X2 [Mercenaria mercenaria]